MAIGLRDMLVRTEVLATAAAKRGVKITQQRRAASVAEARRKALAALREKNKHEYKGSVTLRGDIRLVAGITINLKNFAAFTGMYIIEKATHNVTSSGYTTTIEVRRVLEGY